MHNGFWDSGDHRGNSGVELQISAAVGSPFSNLDYPFSLTVFLPNSAPNTHTGAVTEEKESLYKCKRAGDVLKTIQTQPNNLKHHAEVTVRQVLSVV